MTLTSAIRVLLRHWLPIALVTLLAGAGTFAVSSTRTPVFTATATEYFTIAVGDSTSEVAQGNSFLQDQMPSFGQLAVSPAVLNPVIDDLGLQTTLKDLGRAIEVTTPRNTVILEINASSTDPETAAAIANAVGSQLANALDTVGPKLPNGRAVIEVQSIQTALPPTIQSAPNTRRNVALGLLIGLLLSAGIVLALSRLDSRVRTPDTLAELTPRRLLGSVRRAPNLHNRNLAVVRDPGSASAEDIRHLRSGVERLALDRPSYVLAVTSSVRNEGRSTLAANLAAALGEAGRTAVLVDADLRRPRVAQITRIDGSTGLLSVLNEPHRVAQVVQTVTDGHFDALAAGGTHPNPTEVLSSGGVAQVLAELRERYEFVLLDTPAVLSASDVTALRGQLDGVLVVADATRVRRGQLVTALSNNDLAGLTTVGVVLNLVRDADLPPSSGYVGSDGRQTRADRDVLAGSRRVETTPVWDAPTR